MVEMATITPREAGLDTNRPVYLLAIAAWLLFAGAYCAIFLIFSQVGRLRRYGSRTSRPQWRF